MIFRIENEKLYQVKIPQDTSEDSFLSTQSSGKIEFLKIDTSELPEIPAGRPQYYKRVDGQIVPDDERILAKMKPAKIKDIEAEKKKRQLQPVKVRDILWFGGRVAGQKYDEAFRLAKRMGLDKGEFLSVDHGLVEVDENFANEIIIAIGAATYKQWKIAATLIQMVEAAKTPDEVEAIKWPEETE